MFMSPPLYYSKRTEFRSSSTNEDAFVCLFWLLFHFGSPLLSIRTRPHGLYPTFLSGHSITKFKRTERGRGC
jgi:hypothetical protein